VTLTSVINFRFLLGSYTDHRTDPSGVETDPAVTVNGEPQGVVTGGL
jgi:hypothetical protein